MRGSTFLRHAASLVQAGDLPEGVMPAGTAPVVAVATSPHPSNAVLVELRRDGGPTQVVRGVPEHAPLQEAAQWFRAVLAPLEEGRRVDYRVALTRAGQRLAALPADGSWLTVTGGPAAATSSRTQCSAQSVTGAPRWDYDLTFFAALTITFRSEILGETPEGYRIDFFVESGRVVGPRIDAVLRRDGGDWMVVRRDGIGVLDVRITYETSGGALILYRAGGVLDLGPDGYAKVAAGQLIGHPPLYSTATFVTGHPDWLWLNRCQGFGIGRVVLEALQVQTDLYLPEVLGRCADA